jgi:hypothetical protein
MKKGLLLIIALLGLLPKGYSQKASVEQYYYMGQQRGFNFIPVAGLRLANNWYIEGRFNYEALNTASVYVGKTFEKNGVLNYTITPLAGLVAGNFNGASAGLNLTADYKRLSFNSQSQYTVCAADKTDNFIYSWSDVTFRLNKWLAAGASLQQTNVYQTTGTFEKGILLRAEYKKLSFPLYIFNPATAARYFVLGVNVEWEHQK